MIQRRKEYSGLNVTVNTTEECNLRCRYCYEVKKTPRTIPLGYIHRFFDLLLDDPDPIGVTGTDDEGLLSQGLVIDFIGGDSLIQPALLDEALEYFIFASTLLDHKWKNRWRMSISSNGTYLDRPDVRDFILKYKENLSLGLSIDGCPEIHDLNRVFPNGSGSMKKILENFDWYLSVFGEDGRGTKSTLNRESIPYLYRSLVFMHETLGLTQINQNFIFEDMSLTPEDLAELDRQLELCTNYVAKHSGDLYWGMLDRSFADADSFESDDKIRNCGSGLMPALSINGKIYPCFRFLPHTLEEGESEDLVAGDIERGFYNKDAFRRVRAATRQVITPNKCRECSIETGCRWCIGAGYSLEGSLCRLTHICEATKLQAKWAKIYWKKGEKP